MSAKRANDLVRTTMFLTLVSALDPAASRAQEAGLTHLDCRIDELTQELLCPPIVGLQTGRDSRVHQAFDAVLDEAVPASPPATPAPRVQKPQSVAANLGPKTPSCPRYKTYDPATNTYRGYDGVVRKCR